MAKRRFHVVKTDDPAAVFDDLDALQQEKPVVATKRARTTETFARFPHNRALAMPTSISNAGWKILVELDRLILKGRPNNDLHEQGLRRCYQDRDPTAQGDRSDPSLVSGTAVKARVGLTAKSG